jgi:CheY-like chemotaxis protein
LLTYAATDIPTLLIVSSFFSSTTRRIVAMMPTYIYKTGITNTSTESNMALFGASMLSASFTTAATTNKQYPGVAPGARPLVLVVEDTDVSASLICMHLRKLLCGSHRVENGKAAIEMLHSAPDVNMYSLILMDLRMPVMDGFEATKIIKRSWNIPVVALTGETSDENQRRCHEIGFDDYTTKPLKRPQLKDLLHKYIPGYQGPTL